MSATLFLPDSPDGACAVCGELLTAHGRCPRCAERAHDFRLLAFEPAVFRSRPDGGASVTTHGAPSCRPSFHGPLANAADGLRAMSATADAAQVFALHQVLAAVLEAESACPAGDACAWGGQ